MDDNKNVSVCISDRKHLNITVNIYHCGNRDVQTSMVIKESNYSFCYINKGEGTIEVGRKCFEIKENQGFVIFPNMATTIKCSSSEPINFTWMAFSGYLVEHYLERANVTVTTPMFYDTPSLELRDKFESFVSVSRKLPNRYCKMMSIIYGVLAFLIDHRKDEFEADINSKELYLYRALDFIDINYNHNISVQDIANDVGVSRKVLYNIFKSYTNFSPKDYLIFYRMDRATKLLRNQNLTIDHISEAVGYSNQFYFSKAFKKIVGVTPSEYRNQVNTDPTVNYLAPIEFINEKWHRIIRKF